MKLFGICNVQSARKHRRAGHQVQENGDGRFKWRLHPRTVMQLVNSGKLSPSVARKFYPDQKLVAVRRPDLSGNSPTAIIVDEADCPVTSSEPLKLSGRMVEISTPRRVEVPTERGMVCISVGDAYWPKRRNQHSKPYHVVGFMVGTGDVMFTRNDPYGGDDIDAMPVRKFIDVIGKQA
ncbi:hypothetical protein CPT_Silvanus_061 [Stenotrophomonas phage Silvanus]|nr:hypothetical protein CPT_Silvanus_061 [Stenotrophomonas phage Silvanus]